MSRASIQDKIGERVDESKNVSSAKRRGRNKPDESVSADGGAAHPAEHLRDITGLQKDVLEAFRQMSHDWFEKTQSEIRLAAEFSAGLSAARSMPEVIAAWQAWWTKRLGMMVEDGVHMCANAEKLLRAGRSFGKDDGR